MNGASTLTIDRATARVLAAAIRHAREFECEPVLTIAECRICAAVLELREAGGVDLLRRLEAAGS